MFNVRIPRMPLSMPPRPWRRGRRRPHNAHAVAAKAGRKQGGFAIPLPDERTLLKASPGSTRATLRGIAQKEIRRTPSGAGPRSQGLRPLNRWIATARRTASVPPSWLPSHTIPACWSLYATTTRGVWPSWHRSGIRLAERRSLPSQQMACDFWRFCPSPAGGQATETGD